MAEHEGRFRILRYLAYLTRFGLSIILPPLLMTLLGVYFVDQRGAPEWLPVVLLAVGLVSAGCSFYKFAMEFIKMSKREGRVQDED